jgi:hypothetical protein
VDDDAPPGGDGLTWSTAFNDLRDATDIILPGDEIRVAAGSYKPDRGTDDRSATFKLVSDVGVYGGYAGYGAADPDERDPQAYETILDGDIGTVGYKWDNSWHVLWAMDAQGVIFDGFTVTGGSGHNEAGGMRIENGSVTVANCLFVQNSGHFGGGIWFNTGDITVADCLFMQNCNGAYGGGMDILHASATLLNCRFFDNGNCQAAQLAKGGALCTWSSQLTAVNCLFSGNHVQDAYGGYGGAIYDAFSHVSLVNCTFSDNEAGNSGGAICLYSDETDMTLVNCIVWGNTAPTDPQISGPVTVIYSDVEGGWGGDGNIDADPLFVDPDGPDNDPNTFDDNDHRLAFGSPCIDAGDNTAVPPEVATDLDGEPRFVDDPATEDTGYGDPPIVDMGAYEFQGGAPIPGDLDGDGDVDLSDLAQLLSNYGMSEGATYEDGDLDGDGDVDLSDLAGLLANYGVGT